MKNVYLNSDLSVREILPPEAIPIEDWYNAEFASHCIEAPDNVEQNWEYDPVNDIWYEPGMRPGRKTSMEQFLETALDAI